MNQKHPRHSTRKDGRKGFHLAFNDEEFEALVQLKEMTGANTINEVAQSLCCVVGKDQELLRELAAKVAGCLQNPTPVGEI